ncbi:MAG TPA: SCO family protein [Candidatus Limnocylindrales bacterium]|nr:SCO family protein [Candidatus Limnocylindrales bacterium]
MTDRPSDTAPLSRKAALGGGLLLAVLAIAGVGLLAAVFLARDPGPGGTAVATPTADPASFAYADVGPAPALELTDQDGQPFKLTSFLGRPALVFFGYTHCPDVCPATVGKVNEALIAVGEGPRAVFISIDPERDDVAAMKSYLQYLPKSYVGLSGTPQAIHENAVRWGVSYTKQEQDSAAGYAMGHTADIFLVDAKGMLRAHFPFGTESDAIVDQLRALLAEAPVAALASIPAVSQPPASPAPATPAPGTPAPATPAPATEVPVPSPAATAITILPEVISTSIWAGTGIPIILRAADSTGRRIPVTDGLTVQLASFDGTPQGAPVTAQGLLPEGETQAYFIATLDIPSPGAWRLKLASGSAVGDITVNALDQGASLPIGGPAPDIDTPTLDDVGGVVRAVTTQPQPDLRLSRISTADARAMGKPYVIVIDSARFKVSPECGRALTMIRYLLDRWADEAVFIHLEPFEYKIITEEPVLSGTLTDPPMNRYSLAWGLGDATWPGTRMPWVFVVDGNGTIRAKYTGIVGSADIDVILSQVRAEAGG